MIELGPGADLFRLVGEIFWLLVLGGLLAALLVPKTRIGKTLAVAFVAGLFLAFPGRWAWERKQERDASRARLDKAEAIFKERCKTAGERIHRTVEGVEGILLMKLRQKDRNFANQFAMDDPYGEDVSGDGYIVNFLLPRNDKGSLVEQAGVTKGYRYVEAVDPEDKQRYRYAGVLKEVAHTTSILMGGDGKTTFKTTDFVLDKTPASGPAPRYGVTYDDISTREEREYWIAGSSLKVIDLQTNEVIAERIGYKIDPGQGSKAGFRSPWLEAANYACPAFPVTPDRQPFKGYQTRNFVEKVLHIKKEN